MPNRNTDTKTNIAVLMKEMKQEVYRNCLFSQWTGEVEKDYGTLDGKENTQKKYLLTGNVVEHLEDYSTVFKGRWADSIEYPMRKRLEGDPFYGDSWIEKTGLDMDYRWKKQYINLMSYTVMQKRGDMDELRDEEIYDLLNGSRIEIINLFIRQLNAEFTAAVFEGHSLNITAPIPISPNGIGAKKVLHSNMYVAVAGGVAEIGTADKNKVTGDLTSTLHNTTAKKLTTAVLLDFKAKLRAKLIAPNALYKGRLMYLLGATDTQINQLLADADFKASAYVADTGANYTRYEITPEIWVWNDFLFLVNATTPRKWHSTYGFAGANGYREPGTTDYNDHDYLPLLGAGALMYAEEKKINMKQSVKTYNHDGITELAIKKVFGVGRCEYTEEENVNLLWAKGQTTPTWLSAQYDIYNKSSAILLVSNVNS